MGGIHCMFTSANKPFDSVCLFVCLFWYFSLSQPFYCPLVGCVVNNFMHPNGMTKCRKHCSMSEHSWLDFLVFCFFSLRTKRWTNTGGEKGKQNKKKHPGAINQSLLPMLRNCSVGGDRVTTLVAMSVPRQRGISIQRYHYE